ncbi:MAG: biotin-dependent carboxyltransferase family protein [Myxococcota bacterium]|nr:biotin-dependent carboxyltransferase family protein [Deltaproteobacteria bacterium]MDQ3337589.1 biotin-dependent carboxyltransferase family protein [Myxococcota bacterium]
MSLVIAKLLGLCTVQDFGRAGRMHEGLPPGGALVRSLLVRANRAVQNPDDAPAIEILGRMLVRATAPITVGVDGAARMLAIDDELLIESEPRRVTYLALRGGVDAPVILGSHSVHASAGLGAPLRAGATIAASAATPQSAPLAPFVDTEVIRVIAGPDSFPHAIAGPYKISPTSDRVGTRLDGPRIERGDIVERTRPMVRGAIEVPRDGMPIVLGPEHPVTGGYPVIGVIAHDDLDKFFAIRLGGSVRFVSDSRVPAHPRA